MLDNAHEKQLILDVKDKKIIAALFDNSRAPLSEIGRKARLSKESVGYRLNRLMDNGLIVGFNTVLDIKKMGWELFFVFIRFRDLDYEKEKEILDYLKNHENVAQLFKCIGNHDAIIKVFVRNYAEIETIMKDIEQKYKTNFDGYDFDYIIEEAAVPFSFVFGKIGNPDYITRGNPEKEALTEFELKLLKILAKNARMSISELAQKLAAQRDNVKYHLKKLEQKKIILKYRPDVLPKMMGYNWYFLILKTEKLTRHAEVAIKDFLKRNPNVTYFYRTVGGSDMHVEIRAKTNDKLNEVVLGIRGILKGVLKRSELLIILDEVKYTYFPDCLVKDMQNV
ncbi:Lrp/AsnC family transcriptional regulator [Candidatus Woesearchaeota archaeon]|nr:Lrp/AsnC family transcriptional regulator [Candidatus Woesearchaeota archaeon]